MKRITVKPNQTIYDIACSEYGNCEAVGEILRNNPELRNDDRAKIKCGIDSVTDKGFYLDLPLRQGDSVLIDTDSKLIKKSVVREIDMEITTFDLNDYGTQYQ